MTWLIYMELPIKSNRSCFIRYSENNLTAVTVGMDQFVQLSEKTTISWHKLCNEYAPILLEDPSIVQTKVKQLVTSEQCPTSECADAQRSAKELSISSLGELHSEEFEEAKHLIRDEVRVKRAKHAVWISTIAAVKALKEGDITKFEN